MLPHRPQAFDPEFQVNLCGSPSAAETAPADHHSQICPVCSERLAGHRCKLVCAQCGYYMSCADYY
jgi:hypothetical protein